MSQIAQQLEQVRQRIAAAARLANRSAAEIRLLAVSKTQPAIAIVEAVAAGQQDFGESYVQEAVAKMAEVEHLLGQDRIEWHFIGPIQSNKTAAIASHFAWVHSIDRLKIAQRLNEQRPDNLPALNVCLQINISGENSKSGMPPEQALTMAMQMQTLKRVRLRGLMTIPAPSDDPAEQRRPFRQLRELMESLVAQGLPLDTLSMGMSNDLEAAVFEGATIVRIGTDIFGARLTSTAKPVNL